MIPPTDKTRLLDCLEVVKLGLNGGIFTFADTSFEQAVKLNRLRESVQSLTDVVQNLLQLTSTVEGREGVTQEQLQEFYGVHE